MIPLKFFKQQCCLPERAILLQDEIITLGSEEKIVHFFRNYKGNAIFVFDQIAGFTGLDYDVEYACDLKGKTYA